MAQGLALEPGNLDALAGGDVFARLAGLQVEIGHHDGSGRRPEGPDTCRARLGQALLRGGQDLVQNADGQAGREREDLRRQRLVEIKIILRLGPEA